jgi:hypothetical protein
LHAKIPATHYADDHLTTGDDYNKASHNLDLIAAIFLAIGFCIAMEKTEIAQQLVYLGIGVTL